MKKRKICCIYKISNTITGKIYIGQTIDFNKRKINHFLALVGNYHYNNHLQSSFNKYGKECFKFEVLEECNKNQLNEREVFNINLFDSFYSGYNQTLGGEGATAVEWDDKRRDDLSKRSKGNKYAKGNKISHIGLKHSDETKNKIRNSLLGKKRGKYKKDLTKTS